jgi:hypothetical protein
VCHWLWIHWWRYQWIECLWDECLRNCYNTGCAVICRWKWWQVSIECVDRHHNTRQSLRISLKAAINRCIHCLTIRFEVSIDLFESCIQSFIQLVYCVSMCVHKSEANVRNGSHICHQLVNELHVIMSLRFAIHFHIFIEWMIKWWHFYHDM